MNPPTYISPVEDGGSGVGWIQVALPPPRCHRQEAWLLVCCARVHWDGMRGPRPPSSVVPPSFLQE